MMSEPRFFCVGFVELFRIGFRSCSDPVVEGGEDEEGEDG